MRSALVVISALIAVALVSLAHGDYQLALDDVVLAVLQPEANAIAHRIVVDVRLPRVVLTMVVGAVLGVAGVLTQSVLRNPLGEPGLLGVNSGAALVVTALAVLVPQADQFAHTIGAFSGALIVAAVVHALSTIMGTSMARLILVGIGISALTGGLATGISLLGDVETAQRLMAWLAGSVYDSNWTRIANIGPWLVLPALLALSLSRDLDVLIIGDDVARGLGLSVPRTVALALLSCALLSAISVTLAGPIAFVGLVAPDIARRMGARAHAIQMPMAGIVGALVVASADLFGRSLMPPVQLPVGLVTPLLGVPLVCLVVLMRRPARLRLT